MTTPPRRSARVLVLPLLSWPLLLACTEENTTILSPGDGGGDLGTDDGTDGDGDGLTDFVERNGWEITLDERGYGTDHLTIRTVTSDPELTDTDGDGLDDLEEHLIGSDPRLADTDRDQLGDLEEWTRWITNPLSVDSDGDARGPNGNATPNPALFDGIELTRSRTSPSLPDTDGDGRTDWEEIDDPVRKPLVAEVPDFEVEFVGDTSVRLNVEYQESVGQTSQYGTTLSRSQGTTQESSTTASTKAHVNVTVGLEYEFGPTGGATVSGQVEGGFEWGEESTSAFSSTTEATQEYSRLQEDSLTRTESASSGFISQGLRLENTGPSAFELSSLAFTVLQWRPDVSGLTAGDFQAVATLLPPIQGLALSPGERTDVLQVVASEVNASLVKEFLAQPNTLHFSTSLAEFVDANGINFDFLTQNTFARTAELYLDFGAGRIERYRVATNVARGPGGTYEGLRMQEAMRDVLGIPYETAESTATPGEFVLMSVRDAVTEPGGGAGFLPRAAWTVITATEEQAAPGVSFDDIVLLAGQRIVLSYSQDEDQDRLFRDEESLYGCSDQTPHSDADADHPEGDGLDDFFEIRTGWEVGPIVDPDLLPSESTYMVRSSPTSMDADGDGLTDDEELAQRTDPQKPDTDGDGLSDLVEVEQGLPPLVRAPRLYVDQAAGSSAGPGTSWPGAFSELRDALADAALRLATPEREDDVSEIWVAAGTYLPSDTADQLATFRLLPLVSVYGGFSGNETKRAQRDEDPVFNGCVLDGGLAAFHVVTAEGVEIDESVVLDGFLITGGEASAEPGLFPDRDQRGGGMLVLDGATPRLANLFFRLNHASLEGGAVYVEDSSPSFDDCLFDQNQAAVISARGGAVHLEDSSVTLRRCRFTDNSSGRRGGALSSRQHAGQSVLVEDCLFLRNQGTAPLGSAVGGAAYMAGGTHRFVNCRFLQNGDADASGNGGALFNSQSSVSVVQCLFWQNSADTGSAIAGYTDEDIGIFTFNSPTHVLNCSFGDNRNLSGGGGECLRFRDFPTTASIENSILWGNGGGAGEVNEIFATSSRVSVSTSCIQGLATFAGFGNIGQDPGFANAAGGDLRIGGGSPCLDAGNDLIDFDPLEPGFQPASEGDLDGAARSVDGNGDGEAVIDMGAYEFQG